MPVRRLHTKIDIMKLEKIQKRFTKMIDGYKKIPYKQRLRRLKFTWLEEIDIIGLT